MYVKRGQKAKEVKKEKNLERKSGEKWDIGIPSGVRSTR
jgi:hypothetical protein